MSYHPYLGPTLSPKLMTGKGKGTVVTGSGQLGLTPGGGKGHDALSHRREE